jgi:hypothetical protein
MINLGRTLRIGEIPVAAIFGRLIEFAKVLQENRRARDLGNGSDPFRGSRLCENSDA